MRSSTLNAQHAPKWALALRREVLIGIGEQLRKECEFRRNSRPIRQAKTKRTIPTQISLAPVELLAFTKPV